MRDRQKKNKKKKEEEQLGTVDRRGVSELAHAAALPPGMAAKPPPLAKTGSFENKNPRENTDSPLASPLGHHKTTA